MKRGSVLFVVFLLAGLIGCTGAGAAHSGPAHIRLPMGFVANVQFAPVYVAVEKGYFRDEGIELEFDYSWETDGVRLVGAGELPFAIASGDQVLLARAQALPVVTFVNWWRRFPVAVVALAESGIREPGDLAGRKVGIPETFGASYIGWRALATAAGLADEDVKLEVIGYTQLANLTEERVDAAVVYANNEPVQLDQRGLNLALFAVADYATLVSNGLITNEKTLREQPELVRAFARAFLRGLADTLDDPDAAFDVCQKYVEGLDENEDLQRAVLEASLLYWKGDPLGWSDPAAWEETADVMLEAGLLSSAGGADKAFTNEYLP
jgi:NitT/TauT family transport system substrate-binding protein